MEEPTTTAWILEVQQNHDKQLPPTGQPCKWTLFHYMDHHQSKQLRKMLSIYFGQAQRDTFMVSRCISLLFSPFSENDLLFCFNRIAILCQDLTHTDFRIFHFYATYVKIYILYSTDCMLHDIIFYFYIYDI